MLAHGADEHDFLHELSLPKAMAAGSLAGMLEHSVMFPFDTIKTRMQSTMNIEKPKYTHLMSSLKQIIKEEGFWSLYRGLPAVFISAAPSHAAYFASYELVKDLMGASRKEHTPLASMCAGIVATLAHDAISTPMDVVKQRMQLYGSQHSKVWPTIKHIAKNEGVRAFYSSYLTTILLNVPYISVHFMVYEAFHTCLHDTAIDDTPVADLLCGSTAAAFGAVFSTPLDVVKTRIQTHNWLPHENLHTTTKAIVRDLIKNEGYRAFGKGMAARVALFAPSSAICWTVYEGLKRIFMPKCDHHSHHDHHPQHHGNL